MSIPPPAKRGRTPVARAGATRPIPLRLGDVQVDVDAWAARFAVDRSAAVRRLLRVGLDWAEAVAPLLPELDAHAKAAGLTRSAALHQLLAAGLAPPEEDPAPLAAPRHGPPAAAAQEEDPAPGVEDPAPRREASCSRSRRPSPAGPLKLQRCTDPRTAATFYVWQHPAGVNLEARKRRFPDGKQRWELHHQEGSAVPPHARDDDPAGDNWIRLGDLRQDLDRFAAALAAPVPAEAPGPEPKKRTSRAPAATGWVVELVVARYGQPISALPAGRIVWTAHGTEVGAQRMVAMLDKPWARQGRGVRDRWKWEVAPAEGRSPRYDNRAEGLAAAGLIMWDTPPHDDAGEVIESRVVASPFERHQLVEILVTATGHPGQGTNLGVLAGLQAERHIPVDAMGRPSHNPYLQQVVDYVLSHRGEGLALALDPDTRATLGQVLTTVGGAPGTNWTGPVAELRAALLDTGLFLSLHETL